MEVIKCLVLISMKYTDLFIDIWTGRAWHLLPEFYLIDISIHGVYARPSIQLQAWVSANGVLNDCMILQSYLKRL